MTKGWGTENYKLDGDSQRRGVTGPLPTSSLIKKEYSEALARFKGRQYLSAIQQFGQVMAIDPKGELADNAQYWIGECHYQLGDYQKTVESMAKVFAYPRSNKRADALVISGLAYEKLGLPAEAVRQFRRILSEYPASDYVRVAHARLRRLERS